MSETKQALTNESRKHAIRQLSGLTRAHDHIASAIANIQAAGQSLDEKGPGVYLPLARHLQDFQGQLATQQKRIEARIRVLVSALESAQAEAENIPISEKIETMVLAYLKDQTETGRFGAIYQQPMGGYTVTIDGEPPQNFTVSLFGALWRVRRMGSDVEGLDADLLEAARLATESR